MQESTIRIALVGTGFMGRMHAQVYRQIGGCAVTHVLSLKGQTAEELAGKLGAEVAPDFDSILANPDIDVVDICLPTDLHAPFSIRALQAGKHVLCEKPMAIDLDSADQMLAARDASGKTLMIAQCIRFWPEYVRLREIVQDGRLGNLRSLQLTRFGAFPTWSSEGWIGMEPRSGGAALDMHIHDTDFVVDLLGEPDEVISRGSVDERGVSRVFTLMRCGRTTVQLEGGWDLPSSAPFRMSFRAVFDQGLVMFDGGPLTIYRDGQAPEPVTDLPRMSAGDVGGNLSDLGGYFFEIDYFLRCIREGKPVDASSPESSRQALAVALNEIGQVHHQGAQS